MEITTNISEVIESFAKKNEEIDKAIELATSRVAMLAVREMKNQIVGGHAPGTPRSEGKNIVAGRPSNVTGNLRRSIYSTTRRGFGGSYTAIVGPGAGYAYALEVTGVGKAQTRYPFVGPTATIMSESGRASSIYEDAMRRVFGK